MARGASQELDRLNECLTRGAAIYLAQQSQRCYGRLFCDGAYGALDAERKRMFIAMKRKVLELGGYEREFFVSQTPEPTAMADAAIDLDGMKLTSEQGVQHVVVTSAAAAARPGP